ncbi:MAG TPA: TadE/TadG family type IV pilus assembly protein [Candidatus Limnocylindria bacterium]
MIGRWRRDEGAQSLVEFALVLPVFLMLIFGILDLARAVWEENELAFAAREGTRWAIVHGSSATPQAGPGSVTYSAGPPTTDTGVTTAVTNYTIGIPNVSVTAAWPDGNNNRNSRVSVDVTADFVPLPSQYLLGGALSITLKGGSLLVIQY